MGDAYYANGKRPLPQSQKSCDKNRWMVAGSSIYDPYPAAEQRKWWKLNKWWCEIFGSGAPLK